MKTFLVHTGTLTDLRYSRRASMEPRVDACTNTPVGESLMAFNAFFKATAIHPWKKNVVRSEARLR